MTRFATGTRRYVPGTPGGPMHVPLWTAIPAGDMHEGHIAIPVEHVGAPAHSNERLAFERTLREKVTRWIEWKVKHGWRLSTIEGPALCDHCGKRFSNLLPHVCGPYDPPFDSTKNDKDESVKWYWVSARFQLESPLYMPLNDLLASEDDAALYGVDLSKPKPVSTRITGKGETDIHNPLKFAEARRKALGLKRKDLLLGPLSKPL